jgi:two-component system, chemotaxis family, protein-glutamate methylesterase/glutaminase
MNDSTTRAPRSRPPVVALASSAGGVQALGLVLSGLSADFPAAVVVVQHRMASGNYLADVLSRRTSLRVKDGEEGESLRPGVVLLAPPDLHLLVKPDFTLGLSKSAKVCFVRPSADRLFESVAASVKAQAIAVVLTGGGSDGSNGVRAIKAAGGFVIAQDVASSNCPAMP